MFSFAFPRDREKSADCVSLSKRDALSDKTSLLTALTFRSFSLFYIPRHAPEMATAVLSSSSIPIAQGVDVAPTKGGVTLAIGSLATAGDGRYQSLISNLQEGRQVERQMLDRLLDGGEFLLADLLLIEMSLTLKT